MPFPPPQDLPNPEIESESPTLAGAFFTTEPPGKPNLCLSHHFSERSPGEGNDNPFQDSCLENSRDRGVWQATVHGIAKSQIQLSDSHTQKIENKLKLMVTEGESDVCVCESLSRIQLLQPGHNSPVSSVHGIS